jgi:hypothetical protein
MIGLFIGFMPRLVLLAQMIRKRRLFLLHRRLYLFNMSINQILTKLWNSRSVPPDSFRAVAASIGGYDLVEEYLAAKFWPLTYGWAAKSFSKFKLCNLTHPISCPKFGLERPANSSDEVVAVEVEHEAIALLGVYNKREHKAFLDSCSYGSCSNHCFYEMRIKYEAREAPPEPIKRGRGVGNVVLEEPAAKKGKKETSSAVVGFSRQITFGKPPKVPSAKLSSSQMGVRKKKDAGASKYSFKIAEYDMGSPAFMKALKATERSVPWGVGSRGRSIEIDVEQFGSLHADLDSVGAVILDLHRKPSAPTRMVNLVDEESDEEAPKVPSEGISKDVEPSLLKVRSSPTREVMPASSFGVGGDGATVPKEAKLTDEAVPRSFTELGEVLVTHHLAFQGPDIDPYLRYALEVDVANLMTELGGMLGGPGTEGSAEAGTSAQVRGFSEELEYFDDDGCFSRLMIHSCFYCVYVLA